MFYLFIYTNGVTFYVFLYFFLDSVMRLDNIPYYYIKIFLIPSSCCIIFRIVNILFYLAIFLSRNIKEFQFFLVINDFYCVLNVSILFLGLFFLFLILFFLGDFNFSNGFSYHLHMDDAQISLQTRIFNCLYRQLH